MRTVLDDTLLKEYTYFGLRNKNNFSILLLNKTIFGKYIVLYYLHNKVTLDKTLLVLDAIRKSKFKNSTDDEIIDVIGKWLTTSKSRLE